MTEVQEKSELETLLEKNVSCVGLSDDEFNRAWELIETAEDTEKVCWLCKNNKAIFDTGLCKGHAEKALLSRK